MSKITRAEYVLQVTEMFQENPRAVLAGHSLPGNMLALLSTRPDLLAKLAMFAWSSRGFKKGHKALKKTKNFKIFAYKNFVDLNFKARKDIESFVSDMPEKDANLFQNSENIVTFLALPDKESGDTSNDIANMKSIPMEFDKAVLNNYKIPGGFYFVVVFGDSWLLPREIAKAKAKAVQNKRIVARRNLSKVKAALTAKAKRKLEQAGKFATKAAVIDASLQEIKTFGSMFGANVDDEKSITAAIRSFDTNNSAMLKGLSVADRKLYELAVKEYRKGNKRLASDFAKKITNPKIKNLIFSGGVTTSKEVANKRKAQIRQELKKVAESNKSLLAKFEVTQNTKSKNHIHGLIKANNLKAKQLRAKLKVYEPNNITLKNIRNKFSMLAQANSEYEKYLAAGNSVTQSLNKAINGLPVSQQVKQQISQQVSQNISGGMQGDLALQQSGSQYISEADVQKAIQEQVIQQAAEQEEITAQQISAATDMNDLQSIQLDELPIDNLDLDIDLQTDPDLLTAQQLVDDFGVELGDDDIALDADDDALDAQASSLAGGKFSIAKLLKSITGQD